MLCGALALLGVSVISGWLLDIAPLKSVAPGLPTMKFNTALAFLLVGLGLGLAPSRSAGARTAAVALGAVAGLVGALTLFQYATGADLGIDELVVRDHSSIRNTGIPGRMSPLSAAAWVALGLTIALLAKARHRRWLTAAHLLGGFAGLIAFFSAAGYAFGAEGLGAFGRYTFIAVHTATGLMVCTLAVLMTRSGEGWLGGFGDAPAARSTLLGLMPVSVVLPAAVGMVLLFLSGLGAFDAAFAFTLFVPLMTLALFAVSFRVSRRARSGELALRTTEALAREQLAELEAIYESSPLGLAFLTPDLRFVRINSRLAAVNGRPAAAHLGRTVGEIVPDLELQVLEIQRRLVEGEPVVTFEISGETPAEPGVVRSWLEYWSSLRGEDGGLRGLNVVVEEITDRKLAEDRRRLLIDELNHRVRNTLAVVQAIARQTFAGDDVPAAARLAFEQRLQALAAAHTILTRESWRSADLREVIQAAAGAQGAGRLVLDGPPVWLPPAMAVNLSLALHELGANAAKYGALSRPQGRVELSWRVEETGDPRLHLRWEEIGGPPVSPPQRQGFGKRLLERALSAQLDGRVALTFAETGVVCEMEGRLGGAPAPTPRPAA